MNGIKKDEEFWFEDGNLILLVSELYCVVSIILTDCASEQIDGVHFNLYRKLLVRQCGVFADMLDLPEVSIAAEGISIEHPIHVPDVAANDFRFIPRYLWTVRIS